MSRASILPSWLLAFGRPASSSVPAAGMPIAPHLRLVRPIEAGSGAVWVADHGILRTPVAVKLAAQAEPAGSGRWQGSGSAAGAVGDPRERLLRQARSAALLGDPHLVQILEQGVTAAGGAYLVMELLEGLSLRQRLLQTGPLALAEAQAVLSQAAGVLGKAHAIGLCHGHLCPEHLFLLKAAGEPPFLKLSGFGDVTLPGADGRPGANGRPGTLEQAYLSPEQLLRATGSTPASDAWALSVTLYELLTTTLPFEAPTAAGVSVAICNGQFAPPSQYRADLPAAVDAWFTRALAPDPGARFRSVAELSLEFGRALAGAALGQSQPAPAEEDFEDEELTMKWDAPSEWAGPALGGAVAPGASGEVAAWRGLGHGAMVALPAAARVDLGGHPLGSSAAISSWLGSRAAAAPAPLPARSGIGRLPGKLKGLALGALLGASAVLSVYAYQSWSSDGSGARAERSLAAPARPAPAVKQRELPVLKSDDLPRAPDDPTEDELPAEPEPAALGHKASAPSGIAPKSATPPAAPLSRERPAPLGQEGPAPVARHKNVKPAKAPADCNPPYYFDANDIRRLKLECL